jgi:membrane protein implicated in regulation of membrane protease activity
MGTRAVHLLALIALTLGCWLTATLFWGSMTPGESVLLAIVVALIVVPTAPASRRASHKVWVYAGLFILLVLFLPASLFAETFPIREGQPFDAIMAFTLLVVFSIALVITAFLLNSGLNLYQARRYSGATEGGGLQEQPKNTGRAVVVVSTLSLLLLAKTFHSFYWFMVWDTTYDSLGWLWLPLPVLAVLFSSSMLFFTLAGRAKPAGFLYLLLIPALIAVSARAQSVDFRQMTEERAERVSQAIETYYAREGHYPQDLRQLTPLYVLSLPVPVIIYGQGWCYDGGDDYYRLGYVYRQHWSDPRLTGQTYKTQGVVPDPDRLCEEEVVALQKRYPDYPYEYWIAGE